jgi:hypothetical protein
VKQESYAVNVLQLVLLMKELLERPKIINRTNKTLEVDKYK